MELVSASKMRRAVNATLGTRPYATLGWETVAELAKVTDAAYHSLLRQPQVVRNVLVVLVTSDRGLCGGFNAQMAKKVGEFVRHANQSVIARSEATWQSDPKATWESHAAATWEFYPNAVIPDRDRGSRLNPNLDSRLRGNDKVMSIDFVTIGKKGTDLARRLGWNIVATFNNLNNNPKIADVRPVGTLAINDFVSGKYDAVYLAYTDFISSLRQVPNMKQLLPLTAEIVMGEMGTPSNSPSERGRKDFSSPARGEVRRGGSGAYSHDYLFEPTPTEVLDGMLPRLVEVQVYQAILESSASEHSARMVAMKNASDAARDMIDDLTFTFNQARQSAITREIAEISAGKAALE